MMYAAAVPRRRRVVRAATARPARPARRIRLDNDARRAQLLELARRAFSDRAYDEVSIDDLARAARISKGLLYHYFPTKRDLYVAGLREIADELVQRVTMVPRDLPPQQRVLAGLDAYLDHISQHARAFVSLMRGGIGSDPEVAEVVESVRTRLAERFLEGTPLKDQLAGSPRFEVAVRGWVGFVEAASIDWCAEPRLDKAELRDLLAHILAGVLGVVAPQLLR
jgi:AcrR family transcriptional regulator